MENVRWKTDAILRSSAISAGTVCLSVNAVVNDGKCKMENGRDSALISNICGNKKSIVISTPPHPIAIGSARNDDKLGNCITNEDLSFNQTVPQKFY